MQRIGGKVGLDGADVTVQALLAALGGGLQAKSVAFFWTAGGDIDRIETTIGTQKKTDQFVWTDGALTSVTSTIEEL